MTFVKPTNSPKQFQALDVKSARPGTGLVGGLCGEGLCCVQPARKMLLHSTGLRFKAVPLTQHHQPLMIKKTSEILHATGKKVEMHYDHSDLVHLPPLPISTQPVSL